ncbi:MAG: epoxide hydrolase [Salinarimonas sp.]|nr:epoxide hydrolase [Salinarimonas sp.]
MTSIAAQPRPFTLSVPEEAIADLRQRLQRARLPDTAPGAGWAHGTDLDYMREIVSYWSDRFDWRAQEERLNRLPQFAVGIDGIDLHFIHVAGRGPDPHPLLLSHGWPGSVFEFLDIIPMLTDPAAFGGDPADSFTIVAPSLPGYTLSFQPGQRRFAVEEIAACFARLMQEVLGYERFGAQGGDWGSFVTARLGHSHAQLISGIHLNMMPIRRAPDTIPDDAAAHERAYGKELAEFLKEETGYQWIQGTRPQTLAYALNDSPTGLAAWIIEKFRNWSDGGGDPEGAIGRDAMLANISLYWFTQCIGASFWPYYARMHGPWPIPPGEPVSVPTGYCQFPREILRPPRSLAEHAFSDIRRWTEMERGGHFAAMEQPEALAREIRAFFRPLRRG